MYLFVNELVDGEGDIGIIAGGVAVTVATLVVIIAFIILVIVFVVKTRKTRLVCDILNPLCQIKSWAVVTLGNFLVE